MQVSDAPQKESACSDAVRNTTENATEAQSLYRQAVAMQILSQALTEAREKSTEQSFDKMEQAVKDISQARTIIDSGDANATSDEMPDLVPCSSDEEAVQTNGNEPSVVVPRQQVNARVNVRIVDDQRQVAARQVCF